MQEIVCFVARLPFMNVACVDRKHIVFAQAQYIIWNRYAQLFQRSFLNGQNKNHVNRSTFDRGEMSHAE